MQTGRLLIAAGALCILAREAAALEVHVDFQPASGTTAAGYVAVTNNNRWDNGTSMDLGSGVRGAWLDYMTVHTGDRGASYPDVLTRDFIQWNGSDTPETFKVTGLQAGTYNLKIYAWDPQYNDKRTRFEIDQDNDSGIDQAVTIENPLGEKDKTVAVSVSAAGILTIKVSKFATASGAICGLDLTGGAPDTTPPAVISTLAVTGQTATQVMLRWTAPTDDSGKAASYDVRYFTSAIDEGNWGSASQATGEPTPADPGTQESFTVSGLVPSTTYYFAVKSTDAGNNVSAISNGASATTDSPDVTAPASIADLAAGPIGSTQMTLTWTASGDDGSSGTASSYNLRYSTSPITDEATFAAATAVTGLSAPKAAGSSESFTVTGLAASTQYYFALKVADEVPNWSGLSNVEDAMTLPPHTWDPTDIGSELWAWGWAGQNGENLTLVDGPNGKLISRMTDLSGRGNDFVNDGASKAAYQVGLTLGAGTKGGAYTTPLPLIGLDAYSGGAQVYGNAYNHSTPLLASGEFYLVSVCMNTRTNGIRELFGRSEQDCVRIDQGSNSLEMAVAGTTKSLGAAGAVPAGILLLEIERDAVGNVTARANGLNITPTPVALPGAFTLAGEGFDGVGSSHWDDYWMEIVICEALPPAAERDALRNYLASKWSVPLAGPPVTTVSIDCGAGHTHQTWIGWDASAPNVSLPEFLKNQAVDVLVNDLGLNRLRLQAPDRRAWEDRYNDNDDPFVIDWSRFDTSATDARMEEWILPFKAAVEARGEPFGCYASTSFYNNSVTGAVPEWMLRNPGEYTEWAQAQMYHLKSKYDFVLDHWSICNEPANNNNFTAALMGRIIKALGPRMQAMGLSTKIQFSESVSSNSTWNCIQTLQADAEVWKHVGLLTYHLYGEHWASPSPDMRASVYAFAQSRNIPTGQTEFMDADTDDIYEDLTIGGVSVWEQFQACAQGKGDVAGSGSYMTARYDGCSFIRGPAFWDFRQFMHYIRPGAVRVDATSTDSTLKSVAFLKDGKLTVVLLNNYTNSTTQTIRITGMPAGRYGLCHSLNRAVYAELGVQTVGTDGVLSLSIARNAVLTIYPYAGADMAPILNDWTSSSHYLTQPASSTTLTALATDPELDTLTYAWSVVSKPAGADPSLATPSAASCAVSGMTVAGDYIFSIVVSDGSRTTSKQVKIPVLAGNQPPVLGSAGNKGPVSVILPTTTTTLSGGGYDLEGDTLSCQWTLVSQPAGADAVLASPTSGNCGVSGLTVPGMYVFRFQLSDPTHAALAADVQVVVDPANAHAPVISSATGQALPDGRGNLSAVTSDADGDGISHWWMLESSPVGSTVTFYDPGQPATDVWADVAGTYKFRLVVVDRTLYTESGQVTLNLPAAAKPVDGDINADGSVDVIDLLFFVDSFGLSWGDAGFDRHCDFNGDGGVDVIDLLTLVGNWPQ